MTKQELIELLKKARKQLKKYHVPKNEQTVRLSIDTLERVLSEQPTIVRCKDCKNCGVDSASHPHYWCSTHSEYHDGNWYCADGERRTNDARQGEAYQRT